MSDHSRELGAARLAFALELREPNGHGSGTLLSKCRGLALSISVALLTLAAGSAHAGLRRPRRAPLELNVFGPTRPLTGQAWLLDRVGSNRRYDLSAGFARGLLRRYLEPARDRIPEWRSFWQGRYGSSEFLLHPKLNWLANGTDVVNLGFDTAALTGELRAPTLGLEFDFRRAEVLPDWSLEVPAPEPEFSSVRQRRVCPFWKQPRPVSVVRFDGAEWARLPLVDCEGAIAAEALDRLSALARPPATPRPELPLPLEPEPGGAAGEWLPRVKLLHPRLIWVVQQIAEAFPNRSVFIMSGYRRDAHGSYHQKGRALDLFVTGVENADLFRFCHTLNDVGCGFYPNNRFVHVDVRPFGTHRVAWVDVSAPGTPSEYVTSWPGILNGSEELSTVAAGE